MSEAIDPLLLSNNENPLGPSPRALEAMGRAAAAVHRYPDPTRQRLKDALARVHGLPAGHIALGNGSSELIALLVHAFVAPGDEVVVSRPTFVIYGMSTRLIGGSLVETPATGGGGHDLEAMLAAIGPRTRLVFVCNPNNPTGTIVGAAAWSRFLAAVPGHVVVVSDEAYHEYVDDPAYPRTRDDLDGPARLVVLRTFSKVHGLAGARVGYALSDAATALALERVQLPYAVSAIAQAGALAALGDTAHVERSVAAARRGRTDLAQALAALGLTVFPSHANFVMVDLGRTAAPVVTALAGEGLFVRDLAPWGAAPTLARITVGTPTDNERVVRSLGRVLAARAGVA